MAEPKDTWDKFDITSKFAVSVAIALIAGLYTCSQNRLERQRQTKFGEVETLSKFLPYLSGNDQPAKKAALLAIRRISSTEFMTEIAQLYPSNGSVDALRTVVDLPSATNNERQLASAALDTLRIINHSGILYRVNDGNPQCPASPWRSIVNNGSIQIGLAGVSLSDKRVDIVTKEAGTERPEIIADPESWYDLPATSRRLAIRVSIIDDCSVRYEIKEIEK